MKGLIGRKLGMTSVFTDDGSSVPCTLIEAGPCYVTAVKTKENDGYTALQLGFTERKEKHVMMKLKKITTLFLLLLFSVAGFAQDTKGVMADTMRSNGRIYVVVAVVVTILIGLLLYVFRLDRKISKLEKEAKS